MNKFKPDQKIICISTVYNNEPDAPKKGEIVTVDSCSGFFDAIILKEYPNSKFGLPQSFSECFFKAAGDQWVDVIMYGIEEMIKEQIKVDEYEAFLLSTPKPYEKG